MFQEMDGEMAGVEMGKEAGAPCGITSSTGVARAEVRRGKGLSRRLMTSFQMDADVARVLAQVEEDGRLKSRFINEACRRLGRQRGYSGKVRGRKGEGRNVEHRSSNIEHRAGWTGGQLNIEHPTSKGGMTND